MGEIPFTYVGKIEDWEVVLSSTSDRLCSEYNNYVFMKWFSRTWVFNSPSLISNERCFVGLSCLRHKFTPTRMLWWGRLNWCASIWGFLLLRTSFSPFSLSSGGTTGSPFVKPRKCSKSSRERYGVSKSASFWYDQKVRLLWILIWRRRRKECNSPIFARFDCFNVCYLCLYVINCLCVYFDGFSVRMVFSHFANKGNLVISWWGLFLVIKYELLFY